MNQGVRVDSLLERVLAEAPIARAPDRLRSDIASATSRTRQRPPWLTSLKEPPMRHRSELAFGSPTLRLAAVVAVTAALTIAVAGAVIAATQSPEPMPNTVTRPVWVTGTVSGGTGGQVGSDVTPEGWTRVRFHWKDMRIDMSDPRLSGTISSIYDHVVYGGAAGDVPTFSVGAGTYRIENEAGSWEGPSIYLYEGPSPTGTNDSDTGVLVGSGAYQGLSAFLVFDFSQTQAPVYGGIFPGEVPPVVTFE